MEISSTKQAGTRSGQHFDVELIRSQQDKLHQQGRLHWAHWLILCLSVFITIFAWQISSSAVEERNLTRFNNESDRVVNLMLERLRHYEDALLSGVAAMQVHGGNMTRSQWRRYAEHLDLTNRYPGISGIGVIHYVDSASIPSFLQRIRQETPEFDIRPKHEFDISLPITYIEPESSNKAAVGLDVAFEKNRREAALKARSLGVTQISGPITLVQDQGKTPGFLFYAPYYYQQPTENGIGTQAWDRESMFRGFVYAPLVVENLVKGVLSQESREVSLKISDDGVILYDESADARSGSLGFEKSVSVGIHGRVWDFQLAMSAVNESALSANQSTVVLLSGLTLDTMLLVMFLIMSRSNRRILSMAENMTEGLSRQAQSLAESNRDLESFAHVVSHDLKTPIRNIAVLTGFLEEDLSPLLASNDEYAEVPQHIENLRKQAIKSQTLISGILEYSVLGSSEETDTELDVQELILSIAQELKLQEKQLVLSGEFPIIKTRAVLLSQVFNNLIGNAIKYNYDAATAVVSVNVDRHDGYSVFSITDNGPGIDSRFHERIFQPFTTLEAVPDIYSSGIGLSIVQRAIERQGGTIEIESSLGNGTTFRFMWPDSASTQPIFEGIGHA